MSSSVIVSIRNRLSDLFCRRELRNLASNSERTDDGDSEAAPREEDPDHQTRVACVSKMATCTMHQRQASPLGSAKCLKLELECLVEEVEKPSVK